MMKEKLLKGIIEDLMKVPVEKGEPKAAVLEIESDEKPMMGEMESEEESESIECPKCGHSFEC